MLASERQERILNILTKDKAVKVAELSENLGVSEMTVRRDLLKLESVGLLKRTFGGAIAEPNLLTLQLTFLEKESVYQSEKSAIGVAAVKLIREGETIGLGAGTTCSHVARKIPDKKAITVVTNAINIAMEMASRKDIRLLVLGGFMIEHSMALVSPYSETVPDQIHINKLFLGATGVSVEKGITTQEPREASLYKAMMRSAEEIIIVADHSKIGVVTLAPLADLGSVSRLITDSAAPHDYLRAFERRGVEVIVVQPDKSEL